MASRDIIFFFFFLIAVRQTRSGREVRSCQSFGSDLDPASSFYARLREDTELHTRVNSRQKTDRDIEQRMDLESSISAWVGFRVSESQTLTRALFFSSSPPLFFLRSSFLDAQNPPAAEKTLLDSHWYIFFFFFFTAKETTRGTARALSPLSSHPVFSFSFFFFSRMRLYAQRCEFRVLQVFQNDNTSMKATERSLKKRGREIKQWGLKRETHTTKQQTQQGAEAAAPQYIYIFKHVQV